MTEQNPYADIIEKTRPVSRHPQMSLHDRAAQFAPFASLRGHGAVLQNTAKENEEAVLQEIERISLEDGDFG